MKDRIGIFGGSFDPPTLAHELIPKIAMLNTELRDVWVIPSCDHAQKDNVASFTHRMNMCKMAFGESVLDVDKHTNGTAWDLIGTLKRQYKDEEFAYIIGGDCAQNINSWCNYDKLLDKIPFVTMSRRGVSDYGIRHDMRYGSQHNLVKFDCGRKAVSSTKARKLLKKRNWESVRRMVSPNVLKYIENNNLYQ